MPFRIPPSPTPAAVVAAPVVLGDRPIIGDIVLSRGILKTHVLTVYEAGTDTPIFVGEFHPRLWDPRVVPRIEAFLNGTTFPESPDLGDGELPRFLRLEP